jgi:hypothetical protein
VQHDEGLVDSTAEPLANGLDRLDLGAVQDQAVDLRPQQKLAEFTVRLVPFCVCLPELIAVLCGRPGFGLAGRHLQRIIILDPEARSLGWIPALGLAQDDLIELTKAAGISYRSYGITLARFTSLQVSPSALCEALFVHSAAQVKLVGGEIETQASLFESRAC